MTEMIALESQPFSVVDDPGFTHLVHQLEPLYSLSSGKYVMVQILLQFNSEKAAVKKQLAGIHFLVSQLLLSTS